MIISLTPILFSAIFKLTPDTWPQKICCNRLPSEDDNVDDHPVLKAWNKTQTAINAPAPPKPQATAGGDEMEPTQVDHDEDEEGNPDGGYMRQQ
jgi:hypothetical protein